ncbi:MAG: hypothetical protein H6753_02055 [Candidatus Omnitrophica bacterium]|nr:hypothetical protein [Candidatus Omnitrophota bacterium]
MKENSRDFLYGFVIVIVAIAIELGTLKPVAMNLGDHGNILAGVCLSLTPLILLALCVFFIIKKRASISIGIILGILAIIGVIALNSWERTPLSSWERSAIESNH